MVFFTLSFSQTATFEWAQRLGGSGYDNGFSIAADASGNVHTAGLFSGTGDFDPGFFIYNLTSAGNSDIFISKLDASGNFIWARSIGGPNDESASSVAVDGNGNVYTTGYFSQTLDFDPGAGTYALTSIGLYYNVFISKLDASGNFVWAKQFGAMNNLSSVSIALDTLGNVYTTGGFFGTADFDPGAGTFNMSAAGVYDVFVSKLDASGNFVWAKQMGGSNAVYPDPGDIGNSIAVDVSGNVLTTGFLKGTGDFDPGAGTYNLTSAGNTDIFISKLDASGNFVWAKQVGGSSDDFGYSIAVDASGNVLTMGLFQGTVDMDPGVGVVDLTAPGGKEIFVNKLDASGNFVWAKQWVGNFYDYPLSGSSTDRNIALDALANVYTTGYFTGTGDFDPGPGSFDLSSFGNQDIFLSKLDASGNFVWAKQLGGSCCADNGNSIAIDPFGSVLSTGFYAGTADLDPGPGVFDLYGNGSTDIYVHKMVQCNTDTSVAASAYTLTANATVATYQWLECPGMLPLLGETGQSFTATANGSYALEITQGGCTDTSSCYALSAAPVLLAAIALLEGPYDVLSNLMHDSLRVNAYLPATEPFTALGFTHVNGGSETADAGVFNVSGNDAIVDWIFVELRAKNDSTTVVDTRSALLQRDGDVVDMDGTSPVVFSLTLNDYFVAIRHRNHLGVMTGTAITLSSSASTLDLSNASVSVWGTDALKNVGGTWCMWMGNTVADDRVIYTGTNNDRDAILISIGGTVPTAINSGYLNEDGTMDGIVKYTGTTNDRDPILINIGGLVPTNTKQEQLP